MNYIERRERKEVRRSRQKSEYRQAMLYREWQQFKNPPLDAIKAMAVVAGKPPLPLLPVKKWKTVGMFTEYLATPLGEDHIIKWSPESGIEVVLAARHAEDVEGLRWPFDREGMSG